MVNNAGIAEEASGGPLRIHETSDERFDKTMRVNVRSVFLGCKYAVAQMLKQDIHPMGSRGWIVNTASAFGLVGANGCRECPKSTRRRNVVPNKIRTSILLCL